MTDFRRKATRIVIAGVITAITSLQTPSTAGAASVLLAGMHAQDEIKLTCQATGGRYFEDIDFGTYGCTHDSKRTGISCNLNTLKCTLRLPDHEAARRL
jgi:hypothetical protein